MTNGNLDRIEGLSDEDNELIRQFLEVRQARTRLAEELKRTGNATREGQELAFQGDSFPGYDVILQVAQKDMADMKGGEKELEAAEQRLLGQMSEQGRKEAHAIIGSAEMWQAKKALEK